MLSLRFPPRWLRFLLVSLTIGIGLTAAAESGYVPRVQFNARLEPGNAILHGAGQDPRGFDDYRALFDAQHQPAITMTYVGLTRSVDAIRSWGTQLQAQLESLAPHRMTPQIGLNFTGGKDDGSGRDAEVAAGDFDAQIEALADAIAALQRPVFLRIGYEFDGHWNNYTPVTFVATWKRITAVLRERDLPVATVWCTGGGSAQWTPSERLMSFYPGDEWVDWWGIDIFSPEEFAAPELGQFLDAARARQKPVMIGEMTPRHVGVLDGAQSWSRWFGPMLELLRTRPEIKATAYINWEWDTWAARLGFDWPDWGDARIEQNDHVREHWVAALNDPIFAHAPLVKTSLNQRERLQQYAGTWLSSQSPDTDQLGATPGIRMTGTLVSGGGALQIDVQQWNGEAYETILVELISHDALTDQIVALGQDRAGVSFIGKGAFSDDRHWHMQDSDLSGTPTLSVDFNFHDTTDITLTGTTPAGERAWQTRYIKANPREANMGVQLVSVDQAMRADPAHTLEQLGRMGFSWIETFAYLDGGFYGMPPNKFRAMVEAANMTFAGSMIVYDVPDHAAPTFAQAWWEKCVADNAAVEVRYLTVSQPNWSKVTDLAALKRVANTFNHIGRLCRDHGMQLAFHNHAGEFQVVAGKTIFEHLIALTDPDLVSFQTDIQWMSHAGVDLPKTLAAHADRIISWHAKDYQELGASGRIVWSTLFNHPDIRRPAYLVAEVEDHTYDPLYGIQRAWEFLTTQWPLNP